MAALFRSLGLSFAFILAACGNQSFPALDCESLPLTVDGKPLIGIEDMDVLAPGLLVLSAYDRADVGGAPKGLFALSGTGDIKRISPAQDTLVPHGISVYDNHILVIDRQYDPAQIAIYTRRADLEFERSEMMSPDIWKNEATPGATYPCNLNDLVATSATSFIATNDRASCNTWGRMLDNIFGRENGSLVTWGHDTDVETKRSLYFANGVLVQQNGEVIVSETRGNKVSALSQGTSAPLPGAPDNLWAGTEGADIWVALHPNLFAYFLQRLGFTSFAQPTRIARMSAELQLLGVYETHTFTSATTALTHDGKLYLSGAYAAGIAVCELPA